MTEGTKSYLIGCHQFFLHPLWVLLAWRIHFKRWPKLWQIICIVLHDIGICGRDYLSGDKNGHWELGAKIAQGFFLRLGFPSLAWKSWWFCAGHTTEPGLPRSDLFWADKISNLVRPRWWGWLSYWIEDFNSEAAKPPEWERIVKENLKKANPLNGHDLYLINKKTTEPPDLMSLQKKAHEILLELAENARTGYYGKDNEFDMDVLEVDLTPGRDG